MLKLPIPESYWVEESLFLAGEYPASYNPETARKRIESFLACGIRAFIDLTQPHELVPYEAILREQAQIYDLDLTYQRFAIRDHHIPSNETMKHILDAIDTEIQSNRPVYVHCWGGVGRTGITVACYLIRHGLTCEAALEKVQKLFKTRPQNYYATSPETQIQFDFVQNWREIPKVNHHAQQRFCEG